MSEPDNVATRLHRFLVALKQGDAQPNTETGIWVRRALDLPEDAPRDEVLTFVVIIMKWPDQAKEGIEALEDVNRGLLTSWHPNVMAAFSNLPHLKGRIGEITPHYSAVDLTNLHHASDNLERYAPEPVIEADKLPELIALVQEAIEAISADQDLPADARLWLVGRLHEVERALIHFNIVGYSGVEDAMNVFLGGLIARPERATPTTKSWFARVWVGIHSGLKGTHQLATTSEATFRAIEGARNLIEG